MSLKFGIPRTDEERAQLDAERRAREEARIRAIAISAAGQMTAQMLSEQLETPGREGRGFGVITTQALIAAVVVFDELAGPHLPKTQAHMAAAIADTAAKHGISPKDTPLDSRSKSVRRVADIILAAAKVLDRRDAEG